MLGAIWAHAVDAFREDVVGSRCPRAIVCALRHAIGFRKRGMECRHRELYRSRQRERALPSLHDEGACNACAFVIMWEGEGH